MEKHLRTILLVVHKKAILYSLDNSLMIQVLFKQKHLSSFYYLYKTYVLIVCGK